MGQQIETLAAFVATTQWQDVPAPVREFAKLVFLDTLGVILAGSERPEVRGIRERLRLVSGQAAMQVLPGVLASAEQARRPGREIMAAFLLGYEVAGRLATG